MKRIAAALLLSLAACGGSGKAPPPVKNIPMPTGAALLPYDPAKPGDAHPSGMAALNGKVYVALNNARSDYTPAGPGLLVALVPNTGASTVIDLGGAGEKQCQNAGFVRAASNNLLYVTCSGTYGSSTGAAIVEVDAGKGAVSRIAAAAESPQGVAVSGNKIWYGSASSANVHAIDATTFKDAGTFPVTCPTTGNYQTVSDVMVINGELFALCSNSADALLNRMDASSGAVKGTVPVGPIAAELAQTGDGRIAIVSGSDQKIRLVTVTASSMTVQEAVTIADQNATLQDVRARDQYLFTVASGSNTVQKIDLSAKGGPKVVAEANVGAGANPWNILPLDDNQVLVSNLLTNNVVAVGSPDGVQWTALP